MLLIWFCNAHVVFWWLEMECMEIFFHLLSSHNNKCGFMRLSWEAGDVVFYFSIKWMKSPNCQPTAVSNRLNFQFTTMNSQFKHKLTYEFRIHKNTRNTCLDLIVLCVTSQHRPASNRNQVPKIAKCNQPGNKCILISNEIYRNIRKIQCSRAIVLRLVGLCAQTFLISGLVVMNKFSIRIMFRLGYYNV